MTRPDVAYHLSVLCSMMHDPTVEAYNAGIYLLLYIHHTSHILLVFPGSTECPEGIKLELHDSICNSSGLVAYSDASWHDTDDRWSGAPGLDRFLGWTVFLCYYKTNLDIPITILNMKELSLQSNVWFKCVCECIASECSRLQQQRILHLAITSCTTLRSSRSDLKVAPLQIWQP